MKKRKKIVILLVIVCLLVGIYLCDNDDIKNGFYQEVNKEFFLNNKLEDGEYTYSFFSKAQDMVDDNVDGIIDDIVLGNRVLDKGNSVVFKSIYDKAMDSKSREIDGIKDLNGYIDRVNNINGVDELVDVIVLIENELGIDLLSNVEVMPDYKDNKRNIIYFMPVTYAFGASGDYIVNDDYMAYKAYIKRASIRLWKEYGLDKIEARRVVGEVFTFYENIGKYSKSIDELNNIDNLYNVFNQEEVRGKFGLKYLSRREIDKEINYSIVDEGQLEGLVNSLNADNLETWKYIINTKILSSYAMYGNDNYINIVIELNNAIMGSDKNSSMEDSSKDIVKGIFTEEIDSIYEELYKDESIADDIEKMFKEIKDTYRDILLDNDWLSKDTIDMAIKKLDSMKLIIGRDTEVDNYYISNDIIVSEDSLIRDIININRLSNNRKMKKLDSNGKIDILNQTVVNAYYQPLDNSIVIPIAMFSLIDGNSNYYEKLGTVGMIIAHEVTHAFDNNGAKFDEKGNLNNWWTEKDSKIFLKKRQEVIEYYDKYEVLNGKYINGEKTSNENIADLGAVNCITRILDRRGATDSQYKEMYEAFARLWASIDTDDYVELLLLQDTHSPNRYRVDAVMSSIDKFYDIYNIRPWSEMWISKKKRVSVW